MTLIRPKSPSRVHSARAPRAHTSRLALALVPLIALAGCMEHNDGLFSSRDADADGPAPIGATRLVEREVEAPEVFEVTAEGLWDGRPSLGGIWVAHSDVTDPERVIIRNEETGRFVTGALFRRERDTSGPALQLSADAAAAIGVLAGDPTMLNVTALRREEVAENAETAPQTDAPGIDTAALAASTAGGAITSGPLDIGPSAGDNTITAAAAAIDAAEAAPIPTAARTPAPGAPEQAYVQIGIFSVQENATSTGQALRRVGLEPTIYNQTTNGRQFWRIVVGPADSEASRDATMESVRGLGFDDAFFVRR